MAGNLLQVTREEGSASATLGHCGCGGQAAMGETNKGGKQTKGEPKESSEDGCTVEEMDVRNLTLLGNKPQNREVYSCHKGQR